MRDRLVRGALAGIIGGLWIVLVNQTSKWVFHFAKKVWVPMLSQLVFGHAPNSVADWIVGFISYFIITAALGAVYAWVVLPHPGAGSYMIRGMGLGLVFFLGTYTVGTIFRVPDMHDIDWRTSVTNLVSIVGWGIILGWLMRRWDGAEAGNRVT